MISFDACTEDMIEARSLADVLRYAVARGDWDSDDELETKSAPAMDTVQPRSRNTKS